MLRFRVGSVFVVGALLAAACGSSTNTAKVAGPGATTTTMDPKMDHSGGTSKTTNGGASHDMQHMPSVKLGKPLATLANGKIDPAQVDLSGAKGTNAEQQAYATALLKKTLNVLPRWKNYDADIKAGFESIGDSITGDEHLMHWDWINDKKVFDPNFPEALVFKVDRATGKKTLEAAMYMLPEKYNLDNVPSWGGSLMQYHIHDNLCFTPPPAPKVVGLTIAANTCAKGLVFFHPNIMVHVWLYQNPCGPFAALEGIGAGSTKVGTDKDCDTMHGNSL